MSSRKITDLTPIPTLTNSDILYIVDVSNSIYGESNKITYGDLAGNRLDSLQLASTALSSTDIVLRTDLDNLTTLVNLTASSLQGQIDALVIDVSDNSDLIVLSNKIDTVSGDVNSLSSRFQVFEDNTDLGNITTDLLVLSGQVQTISADLDEVIYTDMAWLCANIDINKTYISQVSSTPSLVTTETATHYVNVNLGGVPYKMLLAT